MISNSECYYTTENLFEKEDNAKRYENFLVEGVEEVPGKFDKILDFINHKIFFPEYLWRKNGSMPGITLIDFGIGSGKFTLPHLKNLSNTFETYEVKSKIDLLGFDKSEYMLNRFKENAKNLFKFDNTCGDLLENEKIRILTFKKDLNDHKVISDCLDKFLNGSSSDSSERLYLICFAQTFHYLKEPKKFIDNIILKKFKSGYLVHYLPTHYLKYLDGNFVENIEDQRLYNDFLKKKFNGNMDNVKKAKGSIAEHKRFWRYYYSLRDGIRNYTEQKVTATNESSVFDYYRKKRFIKIGKKYSDIWEKRIGGQELIELITKPIFSPHNLGLTENNKKAILNKLIIDFPEIFDNKQSNAPFGYKIHLFYFNQKCVAISPLKPKLNQDKSLENREILLESTKSEFQNLNFYFCGITYINKFESEDYIPIEFTRLDVWKEYLGSTKEKKIGSIAEIIVEKKIKEPILIKEICDNDFKINNESIKARIKEHIALFKERAIDKIPYLKDKDLFLFFFPIYTGDVIEEIFLNFVFTFVIEKTSDDQLDSLEYYFKKNWNEVFNKYLKGIRDRFLEYTIKSSISAIMSRNMSHNIGSHVIADLVSKGVEASPGELNVFYRYLQNRMDFIAQITTEIPEWTYPAYFNQELMRIFYENFILIDRIGVSEGLKAYEWKEDWRQSCMRSKIIVRTGINRREVRNKHNEKQEDGFKWVINEYHMGKLENDLQLAIPGGIVGYHAFYIIIENMIRNSAKHDYATRVPNMLKDKGPDGKPLAEDKRTGILILKRKNRDSKEIEGTLIEPSKKQVLNAKKIDQMKDFNNFKAVVIESSCFIKNAKIDDKKIKLLNKKEGYPIDELHRIFIACNDKDCKNCAFESDKTWGQSALSYHLLTFKEGEELKERLENKDYQKRYDSVLNYLLNIPLRVNIRIDDMIYKDYVWVTVWDDMPQNANYDYNKENDTKSEVSGEMPEEKIKGRNVKQDGINLFGFLNDRLRQSFIKDTGELKKENWGLAELKICAGFLQNRKPGEIGCSGGKIIDYGNNCFALEDAKKYTEDGYIITEVDNPNKDYPKMLIKAIPVALGQDKSEKKSY